MQSKLARGVITILVGAVIWFVPAPAEIKPQAWHLLAIFVSTVLGFILQPLPIGSIAFISTTFTALTGTLKPAEALSGFSNGTIWLIVSAFLFARGFTKTGLGRRIALVIMRAIGDTTLKLGYALVLSDLALAPATPSNTARGGGVLFPIVKSLALIFDSTPGPSSRRMGAYLMKTTIQGDIVTAAMFMTACAPNPLIVLLAAKTLHINISWGLWAAGAIVPGAISLLVIPYLLYKLYPPEITHTPEAKSYADNELGKIGPITWGEKIVGGVFLSALALWATSSFHGIDATVVAMLGVSLMMITRVLGWQDVLEEKGAWDTMIWMGSLIGLSDYLAKLGLITWFVKVAGGAIAGVAWLPALMLLLVIYLYSHYGFASLTAHVIAMYSAFCAVAVAGGAPPYLTALAFAYMSSLMGSLTHYATGPAPIFFGAGYIDQATWWRLGFIISLLNVIVWVGIGSLWWKVLGLW